jgi:hypothetical protein
MAERDMLKAALARIRRREIASRLLSIASLDLLIALSGYAGYLLVERIFGLRERALPVLLAALGAALLATAIRAAITLRFSTFGAALLADDRLKLKERVSSAVYLERHPEPARDTGWRKLVQADGERSLAGVDIRRHFPVRLPRFLRWTCLPALLALVFGLLPPLDLLGLKSGRLAEAEMRREVERKREELAKALEEIKKEAEKPPDPEIQKLLDALKKRPGEEAASEKKEEPPPGADQAKKEALVQIARLEEVLKKELERSQFGELKEFLDRFPPGSMSRSPLTGAVREALKSGDFKKGMDELKKLEDQLAALSQKAKDGKLTPEELERMKKLSEELSRLGKDSALLSKLASGLSQAAGGLSASDFSQALEGLKDAQNELQSLEQLLKDLKQLENALDLAQLSAEEIASLHRCPNCGKISQKPGGT